MQLVTGVTAAGADQAFLLQQLKKHHAAALLVARM